MIQVFTRARNGDKFDGIIKTTSYLGSCQDTVTYVWGVSSKRRDVADDVSLPSSLWTLSMQTSMSVLLVLKLSAAIGQRPRNYLSCCCCCCSRCSSPFGAFPSLNGILLKMKNNWEKLGLNLWTVAPESINSPTELLWPKFISCKKNSNLAPDLGPVLVDFLVKPGICLYRSGGNPIKKYKLVFYKLVKKEPSLNRENKSLLRKTS